MFSSDYLEHFILAGRKVNLEEMLSELKLKN